MAIQSAQVTLLQSATVYIPNLSSYQMTLEITSAQNITKYIFVKQRTRNINGGVTDIFAAVGTPNQLETLGQGVPTSDTSYFLDYQVCLVANTVEYLNSVLDTILQEIQSLVTDFELIQNLAQGSVYSITSGDINVNTYVSNTLYRLPLFALPCGIPVNTGGMITIPSPNTSERGWLPTSGADPAGYYFKYNIATDPNLPLIYPAAVPKLNLAYIEKNGVILDDKTVLFTDTGIFWNTNLFGNTPWPSDYVSPSNPGGATGTTSVILILSIVV